MPRRQVDTRLGVELLRPQAEPVDTFVQPGPSPLRGFADALAKIDKPLKQFIDARAEKQAEEDRIRGEAAFYDDNAEDLAEGVRTGKIPAHYSPNFVKGFKNAQGNVAGNQLRSDFRAAYDAWDGKNSEDPQAYDEFVSGFLRDRLGSDDPEVLRGVLPHVRQMVEDGQTLYDTYRSKQTVQGSLDAHVAGANQDIDELNREGLSTEEGTNYPVVFQKIEEKRAAYVASGGNPDDFDKSMIDAMSAKVLTTRDPGLLAWFDQKVPGKDYTYGDSPYGAKVKLETTSALEVIARRTEAEESAKQTKADKAREDAAHRAAIDFLIQHPNGAMPDAILQQGSVDPTFKVRIEEWRQKLNSGFTDEKALQKVYGDILAGGGFKAVQEAFAQGVFGRTEDLTAAYAFAKSFEDNRDRIAEVTSSATFESFMRTIDVRTKGVNALTGDPIAGTSNEGYEAQYDFRRLVTDWMVRNPNASQIEIEEAVTKIGKAVTDRFAPENAEDPFANNVYERARDMGFENPYSQGTAPAPQPATEAEDEEQRGEVEDMLNGLPEDQRRAVEERARALGLTPEQFIDRYSRPDPVEQRGEMTTPDGTPVERASLRAEPDTDTAVRPAQGLGMAALVSSTKRGYQPDLKNLRPAMVKGVAALQQKWGRDLPIVSGFRGEERNAKAGGAKKSQHVHGNAVDIDVSNLSKAERVELIRMASEQGFTGIGVYANSIHLDYGGRRFWGPSHSSKSLPGWARSVMAEHVNRRVDIAAGGAAPVFDRETAEAFLEDALVDLPESTTYSGSTQIANDAVASRLGNFVGELEAGGNYNAVSGNSRNTRDLSGYTLNEILAMQASARRRGQPSSAVGKYQFLRKTLRGLKSELGLKGTERFTPQLQDKLFHTLLRRRGYDQWRSGKMSTRQFALRLSQEWAALPNPYTGRSYYAGDGLNASRTKPRDVYAVLGLTA